MRNLIQLLPASLLLASNIALADQTFTQTFSVDQGEDLIIVSDAGSVDISTHDKNEVAVEVYVSGKSADLFDVEFDQTGGAVKVIGTLKRRQWNNIKVEYEILIPKTFDVDIETGGGHINIDDLIGDVDAHTAGGSIKVAKVQGDVELNTAGGNVHVESVAGEIDVNTAGGSIRARLEQQLEDDTEFYTAGGSITVSVPEDLRADLTASTSGGRVSSDLPVDGSVKKQRIKGTINGGGPDLILRTSGGSVRLNTN